MGRGSRGCWCGACVWLCEHHSTASEFIQKTFQQSFNLQRARRFRTRTASRLRCGIISNAVKLNDVAMSCALHSPSLLSSIFVHTSVGIIATAAGAVRSFFVTAKAAGKFDGKKASVQELNSIAFALDAESRYDGERRGRKLAS